MPDTQANRLMGRIAFAMLVFTFVAFGLKVIVEPETQARYTPIVIFHACAMIGWLGLLTNQSFLAARGSLKAHRMAGQASPALVLAMLISGVAISINIGDELGRYEVTVVNIAAFFTFIPLYIAAIWFAKKHRVEIHRQAMLIGTLALMTPAYARVVQVLGLPDPLAITVQLPITIAVASWFDWRTQARVTKPVLAMLAFSIAVIGAMAAVLLVFFLPALQAQL